MNFKKIFKKKLGDSYYKYRLKYILAKIFGNHYLSIRKKLKVITSKLNLFKINFIKKNLNKKIAHQSIISKETGLLIDLTKDNFLSYHLRPKKAENFNLESTCNIDEKIAIIIQGPIKEKFDFLNNTLKIYKKIFKNSIIIISTWENENINQIKSLIDKNIYVIFNKEPIFSRSNINHQLISTHEGLSLALQKGAKFTLKTRSDVRISKNNLETFLISLSQTFPVKKNELINSRIIVPSLVTFKYRIFSLSDIVMFGETNDLLVYFDKQFYEESLSIMGIKKENILKNNTPVVAEIFLCSRFIGKIENDIKWDLDNWWRCLKDYFCIIDNSSLDLFWYKYDWEVEYRYHKTYSKKLSRAINFNEWLSLYNNCQNNWHFYSKNHEMFEKLKKFDNKYKGKNLFKD